MPALVNESGVLLSNEQIGPKLYLMKLALPQIARAVEPGQFVHLQVPGAPDHILRRPFSIFDCDREVGTCDIIYQEVGTLTAFMTSIESGSFEAIGPVGNGWTAKVRHDAGELSNALLVGGGVGAAPLFLLAKELTDSNVSFDIVLGAQTKNAHVCLPHYEQLCSTDPQVATDDGSFGCAGFCTSLVEERLNEGLTLNGAPYDYVAVCGPEPLMRIVSNLATEAGVYTEVSLEKRMACGIGACLSCVVDTIFGKKRSCVDGPVFAASEVVW